jgi:hypothetical protein
MRRASLLLQPHTGRRAIRAHEGTVVAAASNQRWASDGFEIPCWNGEVARDLWQAATIEASATPESEA